MQVSSDVIVDADFVAVGLGGTGMLSMLWSVAMGRTAVGVELRGDPFLGVHWNIREDLYHQFAMIDQLMLERYGDDGVPRRANGQRFILADCFYSPHTVAGDIVTDEIIDGWDTEQHIVGTIHDVEFIDDRWRDNLPNRVVTILDRPVPPSRPDPSRIRRSMIEVLDGPSTFQAEASSIQKLLRRYLEFIEEQDRAAGRSPRVQLFTHHQVVRDADDGFVAGADGRLRLRIEALQEFDFKGQFVRIREPGTDIIDLGTPELFMVAEGFSSADARRLGFRQHDVEVDHGDGRGPVVAQADYLAGLVDLLVGGRLRRRIASEFDADGQEYWVRQIAVGHENDPEVGWVLVQVPDFKTFDPITEGLVPGDTDVDSPQYFAAYHKLLYDYYIKQASDILGVPRDTLRSVQMTYGPVLFSLVERCGEDAQIAPNGVVAGDSFGNGHFLTSGGAMTGMIGHSARVHGYWTDREAGADAPTAIRGLAEGIREDTHAWLHVSAKEYSEAAPINFGAERIARINDAAGSSALRRSATVEAARRQRHDLLPLDPSNWRRIFIHNGRVMSALPEVEIEHPLTRPDRSGSLIDITSRLPPTTGPSGTVIEQIELQPPSPPNVTVARIQIPLLEPERARSYPFLLLHPPGQHEHRVQLVGDAVLVGRADPATGALPSVDLTEFDNNLTVSRRHAVVSSTAHGFQIEDLSSTNSTTVRGQVLAPGRSIPIADGDAIRFGNVMTTFRLLGTSALPPPFSVP
ncbi:MAG: hypothetical protein JWM34_3390 [Ilumatobacteraceae bacterium]|nr:hypothetical protein [Ilumatobacteraceae bacterium]